MEILAAGLGDGISSDVTVAAGAPVNVMLFRDDESKIEHQCVGSIYKQDPNGNWNHTTWTLNRDSPTRVIVGAGTYQIRRSGGFTHPTGIASD